MQKYRRSHSLCAASECGRESARNLGLKQARGEYVALLDSDDLWAPYKLELQVALLRYFNDVGFTFSNFLIFKGPTPESDVLPITDGLGTWLDHVSGRIEPYRWQRAVRVDQRNAVVAVADAGIHGERR